MTPSAPTYTRSIHDGSDLKLISLIDERVFDAVPSSYVIHSILLHRRGLSSPYWYHGPYVLSQAQLGCGQERDDTDIAHVFGGQDKSRFVNRTISCLHSSHWIFSQPSTRCSLTRRTNFDCTRPSTRYTGLHPTMLFGVEFADTDDNICSLSDASLDSINS